MKGDGVELSVDPREEKRCEGLASKSSSAKGGVKRRGAKKKKILPIERDEGRTGAE